MKCPVCQAKLLPVDGEYFCLQCGVAVHEHSASDAPTESDLAATTDPLLRRAIADATDGETVFVEPEPIPSHTEPRATQMAPAEVGQAARVIQQEMPAAGASIGSGRAEAPRKTRMASLRALLAPPRPATSGALAFGGAGGGEVVTAPPPGLMQERGVAGHDQAVIPQAAKAQDAQASTPAVLRRGALLWPVTIATVLVGAFVGANFWVSQSYATRVLPGVSVGGVDLGGVDFGSIQAKLATDLPRPSLSVVLGSETRSLDTAGFARLDTETLAAEAQAAGRGSQLPLARLLGGYMATNIEPRYLIDEAVVSRTVEQIAASVDEKASSAVAVIYNGNALLLADKPGRVLNRTKAEASLKSAYGKSARVTLTFDREDAPIRAGALSDDIVQASGRLSSGLDVVVKGKHYSPTSSQLGDMLVFAGPGKGVAVNPTAVGSFLSGIPGKFDRVGAMASIVSALNSGKAGSINVAQKTTNLPELTNAAAVLPVQTYRYCLTGTPEQVDALRATAARVMGVGAPWTMGGRIAFNEARSDCNLRLGLADVAALRLLDPACATQTTCRSHNTLLIHDTTWQAAPLGWATGLGAYREELVGHVVGQWLGFEHATCGEVPTRPLSSPALTIPGCSPQWYGIAADSQDTKILPGF